MEFGQLLTEKIENRNRENCFIWYKRVSFALYATHQHKKLTAAGTQFRKLQVLAENSVKFPRNIKVNNEDINIFST